MRWKLFFFDLVGFVATTAVFLVVSPSSPTRLRLIYIGFQVLLCTLIVFLFRYYFKVYKNPEDTDGYIRQDDMKVLCSDLLAGALIYGIQLLIPDTPSIRISFVEVVCIICINLFLAVFGRQAARSLLSYCNHVLHQMDDN